MNGVAQKALRALLTDPHTGIALDRWAITRGACSLTIALIMIVATIALALAIGGGR